MDKEPETYEELIRKKRCVDLLKYYELTAEEIEQIHNFLATYPNASVEGNKYSLVLKVLRNPEIQTIIINSRCKDKTIDGVKLTNDLMYLIPHYDPSSSSGGFSGGSSSNNNNNNNNNR